MGTGTCLSIKLMIFLIYYDMKMHFPHDVILLWGHLHVNLHVNQIRLMLAPWCLHLTYFCGRFYKALGLRYESFLQIVWCSSLEGFFFFLMNKQTNKKIQESLDPTPPHTSSSTVNFCYHQIGLVHLLCGCLTSFLLFSLLPKMQLTSELRHHS